jgi:hypothetical protein
MLAELDKGEPSSRASQHAVSNGSRATTHKTHSDAMHSSRPNGGPAGGGGGVRQQESYYGHNREEVTRIMIQALHELGYHAAADNVGEESGFQVESPDVVAFREAVLGGSWGKAEELLCGKGTRGAEQAPGSGLVLAPGADRNTMRFRLRQQKFLELLEQRETGRALAVLRNELTPLCQEQHQTLHLLSRLLMCQNADDLRSRASWDGANGRSRQKLLAELSGMFMILMLARFPYQEANTLDRIHISIGHAPGAPLGCAFGRPETQPGGEVSLPHKRRVAFALRRPFLRSEPVPFRDPGRVIPSRIRVVQKAR